MQTFRATPQSRSRIRHHSVHIAAVLLTLALCSCAAEQSAASKNSQADIQQLLDKAHASALDMRAPYLLDAATLALRDRQTAVSAKILRELDELKLSGALYARRQLLNARLFDQQGKFDQVLGALQDRQLQQTLDQLDTSAQIDISLLRANALSAAGNYFASAQERIFVEPLLTPTQAESNHGEIRRALDKLSSADLLRQRNNTRNDALRGWLDLAIAAKEHHPTPPLTASAIGNLSSAPLSNIGADQIPQIALLLPLTGKLAAFGEAVRDGFLAARYSAEQRGERTPAVRIYDSDSAGIVQLYQQAVSDGAGAVVGPLEKLQVAQFYSQVLPVPLLALNRADVTQPPPPNFYQFGLAPEDESAQIAHLIARDGNHNVLIIADRDEANSRELQAFQQQLQSIGGHIAGTALFRGQTDLSSAIRVAMNIPRSEARGKEMESVLNRNIEFTPHARGDVDAIFMLAKSTQARLIKPLLNFYYAGDIPVYSTSRIHSGYTNETFDRDIEQVRFTEIPWVLQASPLKQQILAANPGAKNYLRLYALGIDSFMLHSRLRQLEASPSARIAGATGMLTLDTQRIVQRESQLAEMRNGVAEPRYVIDNNAKDSNDVLPTPQTTP